MADESDSNAYTIQELGQMMFDINVRMANNEKKTQSNWFEHESYARQQALRNKSMDDHLAKLIKAVEHLGNKPPDQSQSAASTDSRGWNLPPSLTMKPPGFDPDTWPKLKFEPPRFTGENVTQWIKKIQKYYNHNFTPLADRLYLTEFLLDDAATEWFDYWEANNEGKGWDAFLLDIKLRFDSELYEDYIGRLATLRQTGPLGEYLAAFEPMLKKVGKVGDSTLISLFIAGLAAPLKQELLTRRPASLSDAIALAQQLAATHAIIHPTSTSSRPPWQPREQRSTPRPATHPPKFVDSNRQNNAQQRQNREGQPRDYPIVRISAAERAEKTKRGECWYCPEKYTRTHVCATKFYALMGPDEEDDDDIVDEESEQTDDEGENMVITGDISTIHVIGPKLQPRSIRETGKINESAIHVLIDGGSTHNFIKPSVAEKLSLPLHSITPFRVFVGNGASLRCNYVSLKTPISLQGHAFEIDLFLLHVEGPDVILGVQWLQGLGDNTKNYCNLTMQFDIGDRSVLLQGEGKQPRRISYKGLFSLVGQAPDAEIFEIVQLPSDSSAQITPTAQPSPPLQAVVDAFPGVFEVPSGLPPTRRWDHKIHKPSPSRKQNLDTKSTA